MKLAELLSGIEIIEGCYDPALEVTGATTRGRQSPAKPLSPSPALPPTATGSSPRRLSAARV